MTTFSGDKHHIVGTIGAGDAELFVKTANGPVTVQRDTLMKSWATDSGCILLSTKAIASANSNSLFNDFVIRQPLVERRYDLLFHALESFDIASWNTSEHDLIHACVCELAYPLDDVVFWPSQ